MYSTFASALLVYISIFPIISLFCSATLILTIFSFGIIPFRRKQYNNTFEYKSSTKSLLVAENSIIEQHVKISEYRHANIEIQKDFEKIIHIHSIISIGIDKPDLVIVHGTMGSSMSSIQMFDHLSDQFKVHLIDLPGFGRSRAYKELLCMDKNEIINFYSEILHKYISTHCSNSVCIAAHSFGAYLSINFASKHPELVNKLILIDPAGIFPLLGAYGAYWAVFFKFSIPHLICKILGPLAPFIFHSILQFYQNPQSSDYLFQLISCKSAFAHHFIGRFINITFSRSSWTQPVLHILTRLPMPIGFIYGENDNIMPSHQGIIFSKITNNNIPVNIILGAGHSPQFSHPVECASAIIDIYTNTAKCVPQVYTECIKKRVTYEELIGYYGSYSTKDTLCKINDLYKKLDF